MTPRKGEGPTETDRFERLAKALVRVPKKEIDAQRQSNGSKPSPSGRRKSADDR